MRHDKRTRSRGRSTMSTDVAREVQGLEDTESAVAPAIATEDGQRPRLAAFEDKVAMEFK